MKSEEEKECSSNFNKEISVYNCHVLVHKYNIPELGLVYFYSIMSFCIYSSVNVSKSK